MNGQQLSLLGLLAFAVVTNVICMGGLPTAEPRNAQQALAIVIAQPGSNREPTGESALWIA
jgi:hypothetical protein